MSSLSVETVGGGTPHISSVLSRGLPSGSVDGRYHKIISFVTTAVHPYTVEYISLNSNYST